MIWSYIIIFRPPEHRKHHLNPKWGDLISSPFMYACCVSSTYTIGQYEQSVVDRLFFAGQSYARDCDGLLSAFTHYSSNHENNPGSGPADSCNVSFIPRHHVPAVQSYAGTLPVIKPSPGEVLAPTHPAAAITRPPPTSD